MSAQSLVREGFVRMSAKLLNNDVSYVYGISVPNVRPEHHSINSQQYEWDQFEIGDVDMTGLPVLANHKDKMQRIGEIAAYEPLRGEARVLMALDSDTFYGNFAEAAVSTDFYGSMSLSHHFRSAATIAASAPHDSTNGPYAPTDVVTRKTALEVSLCQQPARPGAVVLEFCPSTKALLRQPYDYLRLFAQRFNYPPPSDASLPAAARGFVTEHVALNTPVLRAYVTQTLAPLVEQRLATLVNTAKFMRSEPILPSATAHAATVDTGTVRMSNPTPGATPTPQAAATGGGNSGMQVDAPPAASPGTANAAATPALFGASTPASGNSMALDPPSGAPAKTASTNSSTRVDVGSSDTPPELPELLATLHANNMQMKQRLDAYEAQDKAARDAKAAEEKRVALDRVKQTDLAAQTAISTFAANSKYTEQEKAQLLDAHKRMMESADKLGIPVEKRHEFVAPMFETIVRASKRARQDEDEGRKNALNETVRSIHEQIKAAKSSATMHGGYTAPLDEPGMSTSSSSSSAFTPVSGTVSASSGTKDASYLDVYGLTPEDYKRHATGTADMSAQQEGKVDASKSTAGRNNSRHAAAEIKADDPDAIGKVYASLCTLNGDGTITLPSHDEVAVGGMVTEARVKRSANGEEQRFEVQVPRWADKKRIGLQHLFPATFEKMQEPLFNYDAKLDEAALKKAVAAGKGHEAMNNVIPRLVSRRRKGSYQKNFVYCDPRRRGTEHESYMDIPAAEVE